MPGGDYRDALRERAGWEPEPGPILDADGARVGEHGGSAGFTVGQRRGIGVAARRAALRQPDRPAVEHDPAGPARGPRDDDRAAERRLVRGGRAAGRRGARRSAPRSGSAIARRRSPATVRPATAREPRPRRALDRRDRRPRSGPRRPARRPCCTPATSSLGGGRIESSATVGPVRSPRDHVTRKPIAAA